MPETARPRGSPAWRDKTSGLTPTSSAGNNEYASIFRVLVVEDDAQIVESVILCLRLRWPGLILIATASGTDAVRLVRSAAPELVLLDLTLPDLYGLQVLREIRGLSGVPVIIMTANNEELARLKSFEMGTTDYIVKPFSHLELLGSVIASLKDHGRHNQPGSTPPWVAGLVIDLVGHRVLHDEIEADLTLIEWKLLGALLQNQGQTTPFAELARRGWDDSPVPRSRLRACLRQVQLKLGDNPERPGFLTSDKVGYCLQFFS